MVKKNYLCTAIVLILGITLFLPGTAGAFPGGGEKICPIKAFFYSFFGITEEQQAALDAIKDETREAKRALYEDIRELDISDRLQEILLAEEIDTEAAQALFDQLMDLGKSSDAFSDQSKIAMAKVLTAEQRVNIGVMVTDITAFIDYIMAYPELDYLKETYLEPMRTYYMERALEFLELTDEQMTAIADLLEETRATIEPIADEKKELSRQLASILLAADLDEDAANALIDEMVPLEEQIASIGVDAVLAGVQILTPAQRQIIKDKIAEREERRENSPWGQFSGWNEN